MKSNKDKTIRVTAYEKLLIDTAREMQKSGLSDHVIYKKSSLSRFGMVYPHRISFLLEEINSDETLKTCYLIAINKLGDEGFYRTFALTTNSLSITGFEKYLSKKEQQLIKKSRDSKSIVIKDYIECIVCQNEEECIKDLKSYLIANYKQEALELIEKNNKLKKTCYIDLHIKRHQIPIYLSCARATRDMAEDLMSIGDILLMEEDEDELSSNKLEFKFYDELIDILEKKTDDFILKVHSVFLPNLFISIIETHVDMAENKVAGRYISISDEYLMDFKKENKSAKELKKEGIITLKIYDYLKEVVAENKEVCDYFDSDYNKLEKGLPFFKVEDKVRKSSLNNRRIQTKGE